MPNWEPAADRGLWGLSDPRLSNPSQDEEEVLLWSEELGVKITVCPFLQLTSHTQPTSTLSRIKCERYILIKKCVRSFIEVIIIVDYVSAYICICMRLYNTLKNIFISYASLQEYFFNTQWQRENIQTFTLQKLLKYNQSQCNIINEHCRPWLPCLLGYSKHT